MTQPGEYYQRDRAMQPPAHTPDYKNSVARSPRYSLISLQNSVSEITGPLFSHNDIDAGDKDLLEVWQAEKGQLAGTPYIQFVMGVKNAMPVDRDVFDDYIHTVRRLFGDDASWCAAGIGANQLKLNEWAIAAGGHARTGLEDNVRPDRDTLAPSNAALVRRAVEICNRNDRPVASRQEARRILGLRLPENTEKGQAA